jgi:DNA-binding NarL/FixJ family response regulator
VLARTLGTSSVRGAADPQGRKPTGAASDVQADAAARFTGLPRSSDATPPHLKRVGAKADTGAVDAAERREILNRYRDHSRRFEAAAARRSAKPAGSVIPFTPPPALRELEQEPTAREIEVLQLVADGLVNREIGQRLFLSEETVKSHVRHLLAKLQARSRAHAVAVGFRRGLIA